MLSEASLLMQAVMYLLSDAHFMFDQHTLLYSKAL